MKYAIICMSLIFSASNAWAQMSAEKLVKAAFDYWRGQSSVSVVDMTIHRPSWQRTMTIKAWTKGESDSLFVITAPPKDSGNGTLKNSQGMWIYNPKVSRVIKLPPSMMSQSWQGSDFSNNDLAKTDSLINDYTHTIEKNTMNDGKKVYVIKSMPKPDAPVIWGMIKIEVREDLVMLRETFFDEDLKPVKTMISSDIQTVEDRLFPMQWKMQKADKKDEYTLLVYKELTFKEKLSRSVFTLSHLKNLGR
ncbi:MAG: outer membrane lipoprotein-sorting protein [Desulfobacteraceae bacterium]|jgi:outer membrane lipoprotein-sorting protein